MKRTAFKLLMLLLMALFPFGPAYGAPQAPLPAPSFLKWEKAAPDGFGHTHNDTIWSLLEFNNRLFAGTRNWTDGAEIWSSEDTETWTLIQDQGIGDANNTAIPSMFSIPNEDLYLGTENTDTGAELMLSTDNGYTWEPFNSDGFGDADNSRVLSGAALMSGMDVHHVFVGTYNPADMAQFYHHDGTSWSSYSFGGTNDSASSMCSTYYVYIGTWSWVDGAKFWRYNWATKTMSLLRGDAFGNIHNIGARSLLCLQHEVLIGTYNPADGAEIWRYDEIAESWSELATGGFDDPHNIGITSLAAYGDYLYAGTENNVTGAEIWRSLDGTSWVPFSPDGFGDQSNTEATSMAGFGRYLFVGTRNYANGAELWRLDLVGKPASFPIEIGEIGFCTDVAYNSQDHEYLTVWTADASGIYNDPVYARRISWDGRLLGSPIPVSTEPGFERYCPSVAYDSTINQYLVGWSYASSAQNGVRLQRLSANGIKQGGEIDTSSGDYQYQPPELGYAEAAQRFLVIFRLRQASSNRTNLLARSYNASGEPDGEGFSIRSIDSGSISTYNLAYNFSRNEFLVVWDEYQTIYDVFAQRVLMEVPPGKLGDPFQVSGTTGTDWDHKPSVAALPTLPGQGKYLVVWANYLDNCQMWGRLVNNDGTGMGALTALSYKPKDMLAGNSDVAGLGSSQFQAVWDSSDYGYYGSFILGRSYSLDDVAGEGPLWHGGTMSYGPAIAAGYANTYLVVYFDTPPGSDDWGLWGRVFGVTWNYLPIVRK
jgi:hypothetical protein